MRIRSGNFAAVCRHIGNPNPRNLDFRLGFASEAEVSVGGAGWTPSGNDGGIVPPSFPIRIRIRSGYFVAGMVGCGEIFDLRLICG
eukprot:6080813-Lingulodinium_polyedra.AAC.1